VSVQVGRSAARVLVAAATTLFRDGVLAALRDDDRFLVVGHADDAREFIWRALAERPDVALLDIELLRTAVDQGLLPAGPRAPRIVVLAVSDDGEELAACAEAGAAEIVRRRADREELLAALSRTVDGESTLESLCEAFVSEDESRGGAGTAGVAGDELVPLTPREQEVLALIEAGHTNKAIALELGCSLSTVKNHVHTVLTKLGVDRRTEAARLARATLAGGAG
jgi:two-component system nitrate/nitrite response regulator NarL